MNSSLWVIWGRLNSTDATSISFSPLIFILTGPDGANFSFTKSNTNINSNETTSKIPTTNKIDCVIDVAKNIINLYHY